MLLPRFPGVLCALGCVVADLRHDFSQTVNQRLGTGEAGEAEGELTFDGAALAATLADQRARGERELERDGVELERVEVHHYADMAYEGQVHRMRVEVEFGWGADELRRAFVAAYEREYGTVLPGAAITLVNARTIVVGRRPQWRADPPLSGVADPSPRSSRQVYFEGWLQTPVYAREDLAVGSELVGPLIIEQADTTTVIDPGMAVRVDGAGNLLVTLP
jgi:N-methylhydantoinase A